tara:strand:- start:930 stop:1940 length:1011 start_codon:yes stop_codon:yes gene_type:complete
MIRVAINGFGRIGRSIVRALYETSCTEKIKIVAINDLAQPEAMKHLLEYDSTHGRFDRSVTLKQGQLCIDQDCITLLHEAHLDRLPWRDLEIDLVFEATGMFKERKQIEQHVQAGARKVLVSHPATPDVDATIVYGVNHQLLTGHETVVSNASCTTNCCVPILELLHRTFEVERGAMTTIHSFMNDQQVIDSYHPDLRLTRAASQSIIPVQTKLAQGVERILPELKNKLEAIAVRVPTMNVTAMDVCLTLKKSVDVQSINELLQQAAHDRPSIIGFTDAPLVSVDFNHDPRSVIVDGTQTCVSDAHLVKLLLWCDNEWGYANRMLDTAQQMFAQKG